MGTGESRSRGRLSCALNEPGGYTVYYEGLGAADEQVTIPTFSVSVAPVGGGEEIPCPSLRGLGDLQPRWALRPGGRDLPDRRSRHVPGPDRRGRPGAAAGGDRHQHRPGHRSHGGPDGPGGARPVLRGRGPGGGGCGPPEQGSSSAAGHDLLDAIGRAAQGGSLIPAGGTSFATGTASGGRSGSLIVVLKRSIPSERSGPAPVLALLVAGGRLPPRRGFRSGSAVRRRPYLARQVGADVDQVSDNADVPRRSGARRVLVPLRRRLGGGRRRLRRSCSADGPQGATPSPVRSPDLGDRGGPRVQARPGWRSRPYPLVRFQTPDGRFVTAEPTSVAASCRQSATVSTCCTTQLGLRKRTSTAGCRTGPTASSAGSAGD